jgi:hypothetical protein
MTDLHDALGRSIGTKPCRYPQDDGTGHCRYCGWPLDYVPARGEGATFVSGYWRHRGAARRLAAEYPHQKATRLTLSEADCLPAEYVARTPLHNGTPAEHGSYPQQLDVTFGFRQRAGAGGRLVLPSPAEWAAFKARWAA